MQSLLLLEPYIISQIASAAGPAASDPGSPVRALGAPNPREAFFQGGGGDVYIYVDLGIQKAIDTFFLGYVGGAPNSYASVIGGTTEYNATAFDSQQILGGVTPLASSSISNPLFRHFLIQFPQSRVARYVRFRVNSNTTGLMSIGCLALGQRFSPFWGHEWGAGRLLTDTGNVERLFGGGFGIDDGARVGGYSWTFGDLQPLEVERLYRLVRSVGRTRSILVVEDPDPANLSINEGVHWGLLDKLEAYERLDPLNTKWSLQISDWA